jgi:hypothetical protein
MLENRSCDHLLAYSGIPGLSGIDTAKTNPDASGKPIPIAHGAGPAAERSGARVRAGEHPRRRASVDSLDGRSGGQAILQTLPEAPQRRFVRKPLEWYKAVTVSRPRTVGLRFSHVFGGR